MDRFEFLKKASQLCLGKCFEVLDNPIVQSLENLAGPAEHRQRPPGACPDDHSFLDLCTGCDACMQACPVNVITIESMEKRDPYILPEESPCIHCEDYPCIQSCPTGALSHKYGYNLRNINAS